VSIERKERKFSLGSHDPISSESRCIKALEIFMTVSSQSCLCVPEATEKLQEIWLPRARKAKFSRSR
jgi:hypothetical protein